MTKRREKKAAKIIQKAWLEYYQYYHMKRISESIRLVLFINDSHAFDYTDLLCENVEEKKSQLRFFCAIIYLSLLFIQFILTPSFFCMSFDVSRIQIYSFLPFFKKEKKKKGYN